MLNLKTRTEPESGATIILTRRPPQIVDGCLKGSEIVRAAGGYLVWTSQARLANRLAAEHGLTVRLLNGEAEVLVPDALADKLLPQLGARVRRELTEAERQDRIRRLAKARKALNLGPGPLKTGVSACSSAP